MTARAHYPTTDLMHPQSFAEASLRSQVSCRPDSANGGKHRRNCAGALAFAFPAVSFAAPASTESGWTSGIAVGIAVLALLVGGLLVYSLMLRRRVRQRTFELNEERMHLSTLFQTIPDLVWLKDLDGRYVNCNREFEEFTGMHKSEILGKYDTDFVPQEDAEAFLRTDREALEANAPRTFEQWVPKSHSDRVLLQTTKTVVRGAAGRIIGVLGVARDITKFHESTRALFELQKRFKSAFKSSPVAACISRFPSGEIVDLNDKFASEYGWSAEELVGRKFGDMPLWSNPTDHERWHEELSRTPTLQGWEMRWLDRATGTLRWASISTRLIQLGDEFCALTHAIDVTARHQAESLLEGQREVLERIAMGQPLNETLEALALIVEAQSQGILASILLIEDGKRLRHAAAPSLPKDYIAAVDGIEIGANVGSCGAAAFRKQTVVTEDIANDPNWGPVRELAVMHDLRACWSTPILDRNGVPLGSFAVYYDRPARPTEHQLRMISIAAQTAAIAILRQREDESLRNAEAFNKLLFTDSNLPHVVLDPENGRMIDGNDAAAHIYGLDSRKALVGLSPVAVSAEFQYDGTDSATTARNAVARCMRDGEYVTEWRHRRPDGTEWDAEIRLAAFKMGGKTLIQIALRDVTERKKNEESLRLAATVFENTDEGILITDKDGIIVAANPAFTEITGYTEQEAIGQSPRLLQSGYHDTAFYQRLWKSLLVHDRWQGEIWNQHKNLRIFPEWLTISAVKNAQNVTTHYVAVFSDISVIKEAQEALTFQANHDPLTNLPNRKLLRQRIELAIQRAERQRRQIAVLFIDLDRFKNVNDTMGHSVGDALLIEAARRMSALLRPSDTLARWGGDEFVLLVEEDVSVANVSGLADKLLDVFRQSLMVEVHEIDITTSIGVSLYPDNAGDVDSLLSQADMAVYQAKDEGRNGLQFYEARFGVDVEERMKLEVALRRVVKRGELLLHYQPQIDLDSGRLIGVEALLRWQHPELGIVPPARFIPIAEDVGAIHEIGDWVLEEACRQFSAWRNAGVEVPRIAVNLSAQQIERITLLATMERLLGQYGLKPTELELEVTESSLMRKVESVGRVLDGLRALGLQLSVDDFGTGYSSLSYLKRLPVQRLKIDRSFVQDIGLDANDESLVRAITALGHSLSLELVAEGVEREEQLAFLRKVGCEYAQGYFFARPMTADGVAEFVARQVQPA